MNARCSLDLNVNSPATSYSCSKPVISLVNIHSTYNSSVFCILQKSYSERILQCDFNEPWRSKEVLCNHCGYIWCMCVRFEDMIYFILWKFHCFAVAPERFGLKYIQYDRKNHIRTNLIWFAHQLHVQDEEIISLNSRVGVCLSGEDRLLECGLNDKLSSKQETRVCHYCGVN